MNDAPENPSLPLERLALGELSASEQAALRARLGDATDARLAELRASDAEILAAHPPGRVRDEVLRRVAERRRRPARLLWLAPPLAAAAAVALVLRPAPPDDGDESMIAEAEPAYVTTVAADPGETRAKGLAPHLVLHRQEGERAVPLEQPAEARAHDLLQISYVAAGDAHGVIVSIDGGGTVTLHHPASEAASTALQQDGAVPLPQSYELDAAPRFERFILVSADVPLDPTKVLAAARKLAASPTAASDPLLLPGPVRQRSFLLRKVGP